MRTNSKSSAAIPPQNKHARRHTFSLSLLQRSTLGGASRQSSPCSQHCRYACHARATCGRMLLHCTLTPLPEANTVSSILPAQPRATCLPTLLKICSHQLAKSSQRGCHCVSFQAGMVGSNKKGSSIIPPLLAFSSIPRVLNGPPFSHTESTTGTMSQLAEDGLWFSRRLLPHARRKVHGNADHTTEAVNVTALTKAPQRV